MKEALPLDEDVELVDLANLLSLAASPLRLRALRFLCDSSRPASLPAICAACGLAAVRNVAEQLDLLRHGRLIEAVSSRAKAGPLCYRPTDLGRDLVAAVARLDRSRTGRAA
jgi:hypothetical protein